MSQERSPALSSASDSGSGNPPSATPAEVREELARILNSQEFRSSHRSKEFLTYVVENTLAGHGDMLKERTIGIDVYGRPASYDPADDATVRVKAGEVRKRLDRYYVSEGRADRLRIELPAGTYTPVFRRLEPVEPAALPLTAAPPPVPTSEQARRQWIYIALALVPLAVAGIWLLAR